MKHKRVEEGSQAIRFNRNGQGTLIIGPRRVYVGSSQRLEFLARYSATQNQYLIIKDREGRVSHVPGPYETFHNQLQVESIFVHEAVKLDANHSLVVYKQHEEQIERRIVSGPSVFVPGPQEWLHEFVWHGSDPNDPSRWIPRTNKFTQLPHVPHQIYYNVKDVRTNDDTLITVKLMIFYVLSDVETMLNYTHDPIADFLNGASSDIISFASQMTYEEFLNQSHLLSDIKSYSQLTSRGKKIGFNISKVVYRGYSASSALQNTHDDAIMKRMQLKLNGETEEQEQVLIEFKLKREMQRTKLTQDAERNRQEFAQKMEVLKRAHDLEIESLAHKAHLEVEDEETKVQLHSKKASNDHILQHYKQLKGLGVDMTRYLVHQQPVYKAEKEIFVGPPNYQVTDI